jgi:hypothetical protein
VNKFRQHCKTRLNTAACQLSNNTEYFFLRVDNCTAGLRQRRLSVYDVTVFGVLSAAAAAAAISGDKIRVLGPREWSTYFMHESCNDWRESFISFSSFSIMYEAPVGRLLNYAVQSSRDSFGQHRNL